MMSGSVYVSECVFIDNQSRLGGGIGIYNGTVIVSDCVVQRNFATLGGAGIIVLNGSHSFSNVQFSNNEAAVLGGGLYCSGESICDVNNCIFDSNYAVFSAGGGAFATQNASLTVTYSTFQNNLALSGGGLDCQIFASCRISVSQFYNNSADRGGAISITSLAVSYFNSLDIKFLFLSLFHFHRLMRILSLQK